MKKSIKEYVCYIDNVIDSNEKAINFDDIISQHLIKISFYQHERLIHLLITLTFSILDMMSLFLILCTSEFYYYLITLLLTILLIPYIMHYYFLENNVQKMYKQYDCILKLKR